MLVQSSLQVVCHAGVQDSISFVGQKVDIILFHALTAFLGVEFAEAFLLSERVLRDCHVGLRPPRNDKSGGQHCFNGGRYRSGVPSRDCHVASLLAMTNRRCVPFLRWLVPNGSAFPRLPRRFAPRNDKSGVHAVFRWLVLNGSTYLRLPRRFAPRNDKSEVRTVFTMARSERQCLPEIATAPLGPRNDKSGSRYDQLNLPRILRFPPYWRSPRRR